MKFYEPHPAELGRWYRRMKRSYRFAFEDDVTVDSFARDIILSGVVIKRPHGIYYATGIHGTKGNAYGHCFFWDRRMRGRENELAEALDFTCTMLRLNRVTAIVPVSAKATVAWLLRAGLCCEGLMRAYMTFGGVAYDAVVTAWYARGVRARL